MNHGTERYGTIGNSEFVVNDRFFFQCSSVISISCQKNDCGISYCTWRIWLHAFKTV